MHQRLVNEPPRRDPSRLTAHLPVWIDSDREKNVQCWLISDIRSSNRGSRTSFSSDQCRMHMFDELIAGKHARLVRDWSMIICKCFYEKKSIIVSISNVNAWEEEETWSLERACSHDIDVMFRRSMHEREISSLPFFCYPLSFKLIFDRSKSKMSLSCITRRTTKTKMKEAMKTEKTKEMNKTELF